jgi:hypothetical protein
MKPASPRARLPAHVVPAHVVRSRYEERSNNAKQGDARRDVRCGTKVLTWLHENAGKCGSGGSY